MSPDKALKENTIGAIIQKHGNMQLVKLSLSSPLMLLVVLPFLAVEMQSTNFTERNKKALSVFTVVKVTYAFAKYHTRQGQAWN